MDATGVHERAAQRIVADLIEAGYVERTREGRRNRYTIHLDVPVALSGQRDVDLSALLTVLMPPESEQKRPEQITALG